jgi:hypothetical protein
MGGACFRGPGRAEPVNREKPRVRPFTPGLCILSGPLLKYGRILYLRRPRERGGPPEKGGHGLKVISPVPG